MRHENVMLYFTTANWPSLSCRRTVDIHRNRRAPRVWHWFPRSSLVPLHPSDYPPPVCMLTRMNRASEVSSSLSVGFSGGVASIFTRILVPRFIKPTAGNSSLPTKEREQPTPSAFRRFPAPQRTCSHLIALKSVSVSSRHIILHILYYRKHILRYSAI